jgi:hypothetical protein
MIPPSWPFTVWGLDILGPFPQAIRGYRYLYVAIDKFTKWLEVTPVVKISKQSAVKFIKSIVCRFGVLNRIIIDNGSLFTSGAFQGYYEDLEIKIFYASVAHPESNGQVERANVEILKGLKTCTYDGLKKHGKKWIDELSCALWGNRTSPSWATGETPLFMVYGAEVVLPQKLPWTLYVSRHTTKPHRTSTSMKISTSSMSEDGNMLLRMHGTTRHSSAIMGVKISTSSMSEDDNLLLRMHGTVRQSSAIMSGSCIAESSRWTI